MTGKPPLPPLHEANACPECGGPSLDGYIMHDRDCIIRVRLRANEKSRDRSATGWITFWLVAIMIPIAIAVTLIAISVGEKQP